MSWITFAILAATSFGFYNFFVKLSADRLSPTIALMFIAGTSFLVAALATMVFKFSGQPLTFSKNAIIFPVLAGLFTGAAEIFYLIMFAKNAPITIGTPFAIGGTVVVATLLGFVILKESMTVLKLSGIVVTLLGLVMVSRG